MNEIEKIKNDLYLNNFIHVGQYITQIPSKDLFQEKLHKAVEVAKARYLNK